MESAFVLACRALAVIAAEPSAVMTSASIAERIGGHPVVLRRLLGQLRSAGLVEGRSGPGGGWAIARDPDDLGLGQVLRALKAPAMTDGDRVTRALQAAGDACARELDAVTIGELARDPA